MQKFKILRQPFLEEQWWGWKEKERKRKKERREKVNDYSGTIVSERRRWRTHTLGPIKLKDIIELPPFDWLWLNRWGGLVKNVLVGLIVGYVVGNEAGVEWVAERASKPLLEFCKPLWYNGFKEFYWYSFYVFIYGKHCKFRSWNIRISSKANCFVRLRTLQGFVSFERF